MIFAVQCVAQAVLGTQNRKRHRCWRGDGSAGQGRTGPGTPGLNGEPMPTLNRYHGDDGVAREGRGVVRGTFPARQEV